MTLFGTKAVASRMRDSMSDWTTCRTQRPLCQGVGYVAGPASGAVGTIGASRATDRRGWFVMREEATLLRSRKQKQDPPDGHEHLSFGESSHTHQCLNLITPNPEEHVGMMFTVEATAPLLCRELHCRRGGSIYARP